MERYTVLLADDEEEVIQVIQKKINWEEIGFSVIGYATNGVKALEMTEEFQPDVIMTDIKMPYMDGIELASHVKARFSQTKILFFTGFDEFEYAKEAVHLEVEEYILKPVNSVELTEIFTKLKRKLDQEINEKRNVETLHKCYMESLPLLQANFYSSLIEGKIQEDEIGESLSNYQIIFQGPYFCCLVIHTSVSNMPGNMNPLLLSASVQKQAKEHLADKWRAKCFSYLENTILLVQLRNENEVTELTDDCDRFCKYACRILGAVVTVGVGQVCEDILGLSRSYESAREAVSYRVIYGASRAINMKEIVPGKMGREGSTNGTEMLNLFKTIRLGSKEDVTKAVGKYLSHISFPDKSLLQHHVDIMELISALYRFSVNQGINEGGLSGDIRNLYNRLLDMEPDVLYQWLVDTSLSFREKIFIARNRSTQSFVTKAREYVSNNYMDEELSLDSICEVLGVSNSYFSTIFKKETGHSFIQYLTDFRMEQAAGLLIGTNEKSYMIAKQVGYIDPNYFSYVFKRRFGVSPSKYRTEHTKSETGV